MPGDRGNHVFTPEEGPGRKTTQCHAEAEVLSMWGVSRQMVLRQPHRVSPKKILSTWTGETRMMCVGAENKEAAIPATHRDTAKKRIFQAHPEATQVADKQRRLDPRTHRRNMTHMSIKDQMGYSDVPLGVQSGEQKPF